MTEPQREHDPLRPTVSRMVHYVGGPEDKCLAALVVAVDEDGQPTLRVYSEHDQESDLTVHDSPFEQEVDEESTRPSGSWHWPVAW